MDPDTLAFNAASAQIAAEIVGKMDAAAASPPAPVAPATPPADAVITSPALAPPAPAPAPASQESEQSSTVAKLLAKLTDMEATISALKSAQTPAPAPQAAVPAEDYTDFNLDPWAAMERRGIDVATVSRGIVARVMGDAAPPELRTEAKVGGQLSQFHKVIQDLQGQVKSLSSELGRRDYYTELDSFSPGPDSTPATTAMLKKNPEWVKAQVRQVVTEDARARAQIPGAAKLTAAEVYERLEQRIAPVYSAFNSQPPQNASAAQSSTPAPASTPALPPLSGTLPGTPPTPAAATSYEDKVAFIMNDVLTRHNIRD